MKHGIRPERERALDSAVVVTDATQNSQLLAFALPSRFCDESLVFHAINVSQLFCLFGLTRASRSTELADGQ